jgi:hypothetical protein
MAVDITPDAVPGSYAFYDTAKLTKHVLDADGIQFRITGKEYVIFESAAGGQARIIASMDPYLRKADVPIVLAAGESYVWKAQQVGFINSDGNVVIILESGTDMSATVFRN